MYLPDTKAEWDTMLHSLLVRGVPAVGGGRCCRCACCTDAVNGGGCCLHTQSNSFVDMHTRVVILELAVYNPGLNLVGVIRVAVRRGGGRCQCMLQRS